MGRFDTTNAAPGPGEFFPGSRVIAIRPVSDVCSHGGAGRADSEEHCHPNDTTKRRTVLDVYVLTQFEDLDCGLCMTGETKILGVFASVSQAREAASVFLGKELAAAEPTEPEDGASLAAWHEVSGGDDRASDVVACWKRELPSQLDDEFPLVDWVEIRRFEVGPPSEAAGGLAMPAAEPSA